MKRRLLILLIAVLAVTLCLTACSPKEEKDPIVKSIAVVEGSVPTQVMLGETPDFSGIKVLVTYDDNTTKEVGFADVTIGSLDTTTAGKQSVKVTYKDVSTTFDIMVADPEDGATVTAIKIVPGSINLKYYITQTPDYSNLQVEATYSTGRVGVLAASEYEYTSLDTATAGSKTFTVTYKADPALTDSATVEVVGVSEMLVVSGTLPSTIAVGETLNTSAIEVFVKYTDGTNESVTAADLTFGTVDSSAYGQKSLAVTYKGFTVQCPVEVVGVVSLTVNAGSYPKEIFYNGTLDTSNIKAVVKYSDNSEKSVVASDLTIGTINVASVGSQALTVSYGGVSTSVNITVIGVETITVVPGSVKDEILKGDTLDTSGLRVNVQYTNGTSEPLSVDKLTLGAFNANHAGDQALSITYLNKTVEYNVKVCSISKLRIEGIQTVLSAGTPIDLTNMKIYGIYNNSEEYEIQLTDGMITTNIDEIDINSEDDKVLVITYFGSHGLISTNVKISTTPPRLESVEIRNFKKYIGLSGVYDTSNLVVYAVYENDTEKKLTASEYTVSNVVTETAGNASLTVTYTEDGITKTRTETVKVLPITNMEVSGIVGLVDKGGVLDTSGVSVVVTFSDGTYTDMRIVGVADGVTVSPPDTTVGGNQSLKVYYCQSETTFTYHVKAVSAIKILSGSMDTKLRFGYEPDPSNLILTITYTNGDEEQKFAHDRVGVSYATTPVSQLNYEFSVTYEGVTATQMLSLVVVLEHEAIESITALNNTVPSEIRQGLPLSYDSIRLSVTYVDPITQDILVYLVPISDPRITVNPAVFDTTTAGQKSITFTFADGMVSKTTTVNVLVKGIEEVKIVSGVKNVVVQGKDVDTSDILVKVTYTDGTYVYVTSESDDLHIAVGSTDNVGNITLKVWFVEDTEKSRDTMTIEVKAAQSISGMIFGALLPDDLVKRESYMKNYKEYKDSVADDPKNPTISPYRVGDDNPYYFYLNVIQLDANDNIVDVDGKDVPTIARIFLVDEKGNEKELTDEAERKALVTFNSAKNSYDFTQEAVGKTFRLEICPADEHSYLDKASVTKSQIVEVVDGWNIYTAKELNIMTNVPVDITYGQFGDENRINQKEVATKFLKQYGIERPENLAGIVLHCNLDVKVADLPPEYIYKYKDKNGKDQEGLLDHFGLFSVGLTVAQPTFDIYGNYYSVYSYNIPSVTPKNVGNNTDDFSSADLFKIRLMHGDFYDEQMDGNKETYPLIHERIATGVAKPFDDFVANIRDLSLRDNDPNSNDQTASERHMRGLIGIKTGENVVNVTNVNIEAFMISMLVEYSNSTLNLDKVNFYNAWQGHLFLWNDNRYQRYYSSNTDTDSFIQDLVINIKESNLTKCGGPVILSQNAETKYECNRGVGVRVNVDESSDLHTYVTGQEAWFVAVGQTQLAASIKAMNQPLCNASGGSGFMAEGKITGVLTINMVMVNMGTGIAVGETAETFNGAFTHGAETGLMMSRPDNNLNNFQNPGADAINRFAASGAPVFQSSAGGIGYIDGNLVCNYVGGSLGEGKYITLYIMGIGVVLEYYHPTQSVNS